MTRLSKLSRSIAGKIAIVTGAASGMGRATAQLFADEGAKVAAIDLNDKDLKTVVGEIEAAGGSARGWQLDLANRADIDRVIGEIAAHFGGIDILVNNAGISIPIAIDNEGYEAAWQKSLDVLITAHTRTIRAALPHLRKSKSARIVNIASTEGLGATRFGSPYTAAKHAVIGLTRSLAVELGGEGITVNCICPGPIRTGMTQGIPEDKKQEFARRRVALRRYADPEEVAHGTLSLVLPAASFITGVALPVDGGMTIPKRLMAAVPNPQAPAAERADRISWATVFAYGAPGVGAGYMFLLLSLYVMKFSTDVLLIAPAVMGVIFSISRVWDAVADPIVGYLSDRTKHRMGRRRIWMLASVVPTCATFVMLFSPPATMGTFGLSMWMAVGVIGFYSAITLFAVPHLSLGAELTTNYHERSRLFGLRHAAFTLGSILALASMQIFINAEAKGPEATRAAAEGISWLASILMLGMVLFAVWKLRERAEFQNRPIGLPYKAFTDVWRNPHARLLVIVTFIESVGSAAIGALTLYVAQYVVGRLELAPAIILAYMIPSTFSVPLWIPLSRRFGKIRIWIFSMLLTGASFGVMFALPFIAEEVTRIWVIVFAAIFAGLAAGCGGTVGPSIQSDVIDYDEYLTGERKEGSYFSVWSFVSKSATGVMLLLTGFVLQASGFVPNVAQTMTAKVAMVSLYSIFPLVCYAIGSVMMIRFKLDEKEHGRIRAELNTRRGR